MMNFATEVHNPKESGIMKVLKLRWRGLLFCLSIVTLLFLLYYTVHSPLSHFSYDCSGPYWTERALKHLNTYCNPINVDITGQEGEVPADSGYKLQSVHMFVRHGDRYNMHSLPNYDNAAVSCMISEQLKEELPAMRGYQQTMERLAAAGGRTVQQPFHAYNLYPNKDICGLAHLSPTGAAQHVRIGTLLKERYLEKLLETEKIWEQVMVRSTTKARTFQSALALLYGFLPELNLEKLNMEEAANNSMCTVNSGMPCGCDSVDEGIDIFSPNFQQRSPHVLAEPKLRDAYGQLADVFGIASSNLPPPSHIMDVSMVHFCHQLPLPHHNGKCMQPWAMKNVYDEVMKNGRNKVSDKTLQKIVRLKLQPIMYEVAHRMDRQVKGENTLRFVLYSGHDSTIEPLCAALGFGLGDWPPYASRIVLELYTDSQNKGYIRVLYNGKMVTDTTSFCEKSNVNSKLGLCPLENFLNFVDGDNIRGLGEDSYATACQSYIPYR